MLDIEATRYDSDDETERQLVDITRAKTECTATRLKYTLSFHRFAPRKWTQGVLWLNKDADSEPETRIDWTRSGTTKVFKVSYFSSPGTRVSCEGGTTARTTTRTA